jgi:uncharacterized membrane protein YraQ (UPF0718 family)
MRPVTLERPPAGVQDAPFAPNASYLEFMAERRRRVSSFEWSTAVIGGVSFSAGLVVYLRDGAARFTAILTNDLGLFASMLPKMAAGCLVSAFVTRLLPREVVARLVGTESGLLGLLIATLMGAALPGGPLTIYPVAGAFLVLGADAGTAIAFITAWNLLGYNRALIWEMPFFGSDFVFWRILVALPLPFLAGALARGVLHLLAARRGADKGTDAGSDTSA